MESRARICAMHKFQPMVGLFFYLSKGAVFGFLRHMLGGYKNSTFTKVKIVTLVSVGAPVGVGQTPNGVRVTDPATSSTTTDNGHAECSQVCLIKHSLCYMDSRYWPQLN